MYVEFYSLRNFCVCKSEATFQILHCIICYSRVIGKSPSVLSVEGRIDCGVFIYFEQNYMHNGKCINHRYIHQHGWISKTMLSKKWQVVKNLYSIIYMKAKMRNRLYCLETCESPINKKEWLIQK